MLLCAPENLPKKKLKFSFNLLLFFLNFKVWLKEALLVPRFCVNTNSHCLTLSCLQALFNCATALTDSNTFHCKWKHEREPTNNNSSDVMNNSVITGSTVLIKFNRRTAILKTVLMAVQEFAHAQRRTSLDMLKKPALIWHQPNCRAEKPQVGNSS